MPEGIEAQPHKTFDNLLVVLKGLGLGQENVVSTRALLTGFYGDYEAFNAIYASYVPESKRPAHTCIGTTSLARHALVEIDFIAHRH